MYVCVFCPCVCIYRMRESELPWAVGPLLSINPKTLGDHDVTKKSY